MEISLVKGYIALILNIVLLAISSSQAASCPVSFQNPYVNKNSSGAPTTYEIKALSKKIKTRSELDSFFNDITDSVRADASKSDPSGYYYDTVSDFIGCYNNDWKSGDPNQWECTVTGKQKDDILYKIYQCHTNANWPSAVD